MPSLRMNMSVTLFFYTADGTLMPQMTMKDMEELLPEGLFKRAHRSFIVAVDRVLKLSPSHIELEGKQIRVGEKYKKEVIRFFRNRM
jgi:two-component system, LytTR family, response regulator LytT